MQAWRRAKLGDDWIIRQLHTGKWVIRGKGPSIFKRLPEKERAALKRVISELVKLAITYRERSRYRA